MVKVNPNDLYDYGESFYQRAISENGVDYNFYGDWQKNYAKMIISITDIVKAASDNRNSLILDVGCACGVTLRAFRETKVFTKYMGIDVSEYMINLGKKTHGFKDDEMIHLDVVEDPLPCEDNSVTLLHCTHMLEHIPEDYIDPIINEFHRVLEPDSGLGFIIVPTIKPGYSKEKISDRDESHINIQTKNWWRSKFAKKFRINNDIRKNFKDAPFSPTGHVNEKDELLNFHYYYSKEWTIFGLIKEK